MINYEKLLNIVKEILALIIFLFITNVNIILATLLGGILFGIFPAIFAGMSIAKQWFDGSRNYYFSKYWKEYKKSFITANLFAVIIYIMMYVFQNFILFIYNYILVGNNIIVVAISIILLVIMFLLITSCVIYAPLLNAYVEANFKELFALSFSMFVYAPINTLKAILVIILGVVTSLFSPLFIITIAFPVTIISIIAVSQKFLVKILGDITERNKVERNVN